MSARTTDTIRFMLDGEVVEVKDVDPTRTVLQFLREDLRRTGTKEGCAEGDCGACTVALAQLDNDGDSIDVRVVNSCIQFLPTLDGKELITVESLGDSTNLHPVQQSMVEHHASQCGFCTPGFVMSLFALYKTCEKPSRKDINDALAGNLCRCTGYRPIVAAAQAMYDADPGSDWLRQPARQHEQYDRPEARIDGLRSLQRTAGLRLEAAGRRFFAPLTLDELTGLLAEHSDAIVLAGGTDIGLWVTKQHRELDTLIYTGCVPELGTVEHTPTHLEIGAAVPLSEAMAAIVDVFPGFEEMLVRFASPPIRNAATLGGNIANGSPIGDSMPALMAAGASIVLRRGRSEREIPLEAFYIDYQVKDLRDGELLAKIRIPRPPEGAEVRCYKLSKRFDQDISAVCTACYLERDGDTVTRFRMACGGMAAIVKRAANCEKAIVGETWNEETIERATESLALDYQPISDMRASSEYRLRAAQNLLRRFFLEARGESATSVYACGR